MKNYQPEVAFYFIWRFWHLRFFIQYPFLRVQFIREWSFLSCGGGYDVPTRKYSRLGCVRGSSHPILLIFSLVALALSRTASARSPSPLPPPPLAAGRGRNGSNPHTEAKKEHRPIGLCSFLCCTV